MQDENLQEIEGQVGTLKLKLDGTVISVMMTHSFCGLHSCQIPPPKLPLQLLN